MESDKTSLFPSSRPYCDKQFKVIIIGDAGSGKTSLLMRIIDGQNAKMSTDPTIGVDTRSRTFPYVEAQGTTEEQDLKVKL